MIKNKQLDNMTPEEILGSLQKILKRVEVVDEFIQNDDGAIVGSRLNFVLGEKVLSSASNQFDWPLTYMPIPEAFQKRVN